MTDWCSTNQTRTVQWLRLKNYEKNLLHNCNGLISNRISMNLKKKLWIIHLFWGNRKENLKEKNERILNNWIPQKSPLQRPFLTQQAYHLELNTPSEHDAKAFYKSCSQGDSVIYVLLSATKLVSSLAHFQT